MVHGEGDPPNSAAAQADCAASAVGLRRRGGLDPGRRRHRHPAAAADRRPRRASGSGTSRPRCPLRSGWPRPSTATRRSRTARPSARAGRATNQDVWLGADDQRGQLLTGGRNFETLGEDPFLAGQLAAQEVQGVQGQGMVAEIKHYIENDFENGRSSTSVKIDDQTLHETELQAFEAGVKAGAGSVMCSYNRINDVYGCGERRTRCTTSSRRSSASRASCSPTGARRTSTTDLIHGTRHRAAGQPRHEQLHRRGADRRGARTAPPPSPATDDFPA